MKKDERLDLIREILKTAKWLIERNEKAVKVSNKIRFY